MQLSGHADAGLESKCARQTSASTPQNPPGVASADLHDALQILIRIRVEYAHARLQFGIDTCQPGFDILLAKLFKNVGADGAPASIRRDRILLPHACAPALVRKGRRHDASVPEAASQAGVQFRRPGTTQQAVDLLVGNRSSLEQGHAFLHDRKRLLGAKFSRAGFDREASLPRWRRILRPEYMQRAKCSHKLRGSVQGAGQIVGEKPELLHCAEASS